MKTYKVHLIQDGEGCDYTIGCGQIVISLNARNITEAKQTLIEMIKELYTGEQSLKKCIIFEIGDEYEMDLKYFYDTLEEEKRKTQLQQQDVIEYQNYLKLKNKYEN